MTPRTRPSLARAATIDLLRSIVNHLSSSARAVEHRTGVTNAQLFLLREIRSDGGMSIKELAARARVQQSTASIVVSRLVEAGLVRKTRADADGRRAVLLLTDAGRALVKQAPIAPTALLMRALDRLSTGNERTLNLGLRALVVAFGSSLRGPGMMFEAPPKRPKPRAAQRGKPRRG